MVKIMMSVVRSSKRLESSSLNLQRDEILDDNTKFARCNANVFVCINLI